MSTKKVVVLSTDPWFDRLHGASVLSLFKALARFKYQVKVLLPSSSNKIIEDGFLSVKTLKVKRHIPLFTLVSLYTRNLRLVLEEKPSTLIFDCPMLPLFFLTKVLWKIKGARAHKGIMLILSRPVGRQGSLGWLDSSLFRLSLVLGKLFVNAFTAISPFEAFEFSRLGKIPKHKMIVVPSTFGEEFEKFNSTTDVNELRLKLGLNMLLGKKVLLYHGDLDEQIGILKLLEVFTKSFKDDDKIMLLLVGSGSAKDSINSFIKNNKLNNVISWGPVPYSKIPEVIVASDAGLVLLPDHPWWRCQCPTKLVEFLALDKPVLASDFPGIKWVASNSPLLVYLKKLAVYDFKEAVREVLTKKDGANKRNIQVSQDLVDRFSSRTVALKLSQTIANIMNDS